MNRTWIAALWSIALVGTAGASVLPDHPTRSETTPLGRYDHYEHIVARGLPERDVVVFTPAAVRATDHPGVIYMQDGHNVFSGASVFGHGGWDADQTTQSLIAHGDIPPVLLVAISQTDARWREYVPMSVYAAWPAELARAGRSVVVVDRATFPRDKCCGDGLTTLALRELAPLGLEPSMVPNWQSVHDVWLRSPSGRDG